MIVRWAAVLFAMLALVLGACGSDGNGGSVDAADNADADSSGTTQATDGSADSGDDSGQADPDADAGSGDAGGDDTSDGGATNGGDGSATATIGGDTYTFGLFDEMPIATCDADFFGGYVALLTSTGDLTAHNQINIMLPGGDFTDPPNVTVTINVDGDTEWRSDETIYEGASELPAGIGITEFSIDGSTASGAGLFVDQDSVFAFQAGNVDAPTIVEGTFSVTCPADG